MKAMIFAAGFGTRLKPWTDKHPKSLFPINGKPLLQRNIEYLKRYGINDFVINIHYLSEQIIQFLKANNYFNSNISISDETKEILETGGGLVKAKKLLGEKDFLVINADILTDLNIGDFIKYHNKNKSIATLAVMNRKSSRQLIFDANNQLTGWKNLITNEVKGTEYINSKLLSFSGIHIISPKIFDIMPKKGKFSIIDSYIEIMKNEKIICYEHSQDNLIDVGKPENIKIAEKIFL